MPMACPPFLATRSEDIAEKEKEKGGLSWCRMSTSEGDQYWRCFNTSTRSENKCKSGSRKADFQMLSYHTRNSMIILGVFTVEIYHMYSSRVTLIYYY